MKSNCSKLRLLSESWVIFVDGIRVPEAALSSWGCTAVSVVTSTVWVTLPGARVKEAVEVMPVWTSSILVWLWKPGAVTEIE